MKKKVLIWVLAAVLVLSMAGCAAGAVSTNDKYVDMEPTAAAEAAAAETKDTTGLSDLIRVPFGYLLDWLYTFTNNYGLALILFSLIVKLVLLPMSVKSKKSMLKMSRLSPQVKAELVASTESAVARGVFGIPTFFLDGEMWFGKDRLRDVVEAAEAA